LNNFIEKANLIHNNFYDYSLAEYVNAKTKIVCPELNIGIEYDLA